METNLAFDETEKGLRLCPRCELWLRTSDFGICRARKDGLNLYDKVCVRAKVTAGRVALRAYKKVHGPRPVQYNLLEGKSSRMIARTLRKLSPVDRVREAIRSGAHTQKEIARATRLSRDDVADCLAELLLWQKTIRTQMAKHRRMYFVIEELPTRKPNVKADIKGFHTVTAIMPERLRA